MTESLSNNSSKAPWHFWVISIVGFLWSLMGAMDYVMTQTRNEEYMSAFSPEQLEFFYGFPVWVVASWAIAIWGEVVGTILLILRKSSAILALLASLIAMFITFVHNYILSNGLEVIGGTFELVFTGVIIIVAIGLYLYAKAMDKKGILS